MIDFRYHLVSLISVFLALAVGIALGAGPLKESIGDTLTGQVEQLRVERADLRADLEATQADVRRAEDALAAVAPDLVDGVLTDRRVAIVVVDDVPQEVRDAVVTQLGQAGASVTATVRVTDAWTDPTQLAFRQSLAGRLVEYLDPRPADDAGTGTELAEALAQGLTTAAPTDPDALGESASITLQLLAEGGLVESEGVVTVPADAVVVLAGPVLTAREAAQQLTTDDPAAQAEAQELRDARLGAATQVALAAAARSEGAVVGGGDRVDQSLVQRVRADDAASARVATVESLQRVSGQVALPLALAAAIDGRVGHYGTGEDAVAVMPPRVELPPVVRQVEPEAGTDEDGTGEDGTDEGDGTTPEPGADTGTEG